MAQIVPTNWTEVKYFNPQEFACKCGCNASPMDFNFVLMLDQLRDQYGRPLRITSGYRCPTHNARVSSTGRDGPHTTGLAADIGVVGKDAFEVVSLAIMFGATGIGVSQKGNWGSRFIHIDVIPIGDNRPRVWSY